MADKQELERMDLAEEYIRRYFEKEESVQLCGENKEYLKTYIHDENYVVENFDMKSKMGRAVATSAAIAFGVALLVLLFTGFEIKLIFIPIIAFLVVGGMAISFFLSVNKFRLTEAKKNQVEVNEGIKEQMEMLESRLKEAEKQRDDYYKGLEKRLDFISMDYIKNIGQIKSYLVNGEADTCEDAVAIFEQKLLMQQMTSIMEQSEEKHEASAEENKERFGDPLKIIKENKKKKRKMKK